MKRVLTGAQALTLLCSVWFSAAQAQSLKTLGNYEPTIISSESAALSLYKSLPTEAFKGSSGCFQRAHNWSHQLFLSENLKSMKIFLFFTERYKREFNYEWMYHVAPLIPVKLADGRIEEQVFDPTFLTAPSWIRGTRYEDQYENKPASIQKWISNFIIPENIECPIVENYSDYFEFQERHYCYLMKTPMYTYIPLNMETETEVRTEWREGDLDQMKKAFKIDYRILK